tara:strand:+ start:396 stop:1100 length:705 start_codon:yes stop_codon:yes gene_type:complete
MGGVPFTVKDNSTYDNIGALYIFTIDKRLAPEKLAAELAKRNQGYVVPLGYRGIGTINMSAPSTSRTHFLVNEYLEGFEPYQVKNIMEPLYIISQRKQYQRDALQYSGRQEVWQTSREAYSFSRGDCEDHALLLADWLIAMEEDARVVLGEYRGGGHAWVVLLKNGKEYLLEATRKKGLSRSKPYPLAALHRDYQPVYMFNRAEFWENVGSKYTSSYQGDHWQKQSQYELPTLM